MISPQRFTEALTDNGVEFFTGIPDSFLNEFCKYIQKNISKDKHVITANEGNAIAAAAGYYLATGTVPLVYMQNSGLGNAINPLASLADGTVYGIPMVLLIGWRGGPGESDHAQHELQGEITPKLLDLMNIPYIILEDDEETVNRNISWAVSTAHKTKQSTAVIVKKGIFSGIKKNELDHTYSMRREDAIRTIMTNMPGDTIYVATTGRATRELFVLREELEQGHQCDFLNVGAMGHASSIAMGIALADKSRNVVCLDGDASAIMHMGTFTTISKVDIPNLMHIVLNNGVHESVGGQPSAGYGIDLTAIAKGSGYYTLESDVSNEDGLIKALDTLSKGNRASFVDVKISMGMRDGLGPLSASLKTCKEQLMNELKKK